MSSRETNSDGRCLHLFPPSLQTGGLYKIVFKTKQYFERTGKKSLYPWVEVCFMSVLSLTSTFTGAQITFEVENPEEHYHIPLLIGPYSYTTYRGS
jgi:5-hydroxyisourate hydrolase